MPDELGLRLGLIGRLVRRPVWLIGLAGDVGGFALQATALTLGSLAVVQPALATNLLFGLSVAALLKRSWLTRRQLQAAVAVVGGLATFLAVARPTTGTHPSPTAWAVLVAVVAGVAMIGLVVGSKADKAGRGVALGLTASAAETLMAALAKAFGERVRLGLMATLRSWEPYAVIGCGLATVLIVQSAYQVGLPMLVLPVHAAGEPLMGVAVGLVVFGEHVHLASWRGPVVACAAVVLVAGIVEFCRAMTPRPEPAIESAIGQRP
jgi:drug/metabolite transporter (DMT)-like permease